jgi:hypothetical protein
MDGESPRAMTPHHPGLGQLRFRLTEHKLPCEIARGDRHVLPSLGKLVTPRHPKESGSSATLLRQEGCVGGGEIQYARSLLHIAGGFQMRRSHHRYHKQRRVSWGDVGRWKTNEPPPEGGVEVGSLVYCLVLQLKVYPSTARTKHHGMILRGQSHCPITRRLRNGIHGFWSLITANTAPWPSRQTANRPTFGMSIGGLITVPPSSPTFLTVPSQSVTAK